MSFGFWSLIPVIVIIVFALITKDTFISLFLGVATGFIMVEMCIRDSGKRKMTWPPG